MKNEKKYNGIISPEGEKLIAQFFDDKVQWKSKILEKLDGKFFLILIRVIDNKLLDKIPDDWQNPLEPIIEAALDHNYPKCAKLIAELTDQKIDFPFLDDGSEKLFFESIFNLILSLILARVEGID